MKVVRKLTLAVCEAVLFICVGVFIIALLFNVTVGNQVFIKLTLSESGIYHVATNNAREQLINNADFNTTNNQIILNATSQAIKTETVQNFIESGVTQTYSWLEGKTETPQFSIDTDKVKNDFANAVASGLTERTKTLPTCSARIKPTTNDIFTVNCIPPGTNISSEIEKIRQQILATNDQQLVSQAPIDSRHITITRDGQSLPYYQNLKQLPIYFQLLKQAMLSVVGIFLLTVLLVILLKRPSIKTLLTLSILFMVYGTLCIISSYFVTYFFDKLFESSIKPISTTDLKDSMSYILNTIINSVHNTLLKTGVVFIIICVVCLVIYLLTNRKQYQKNQKSLLGIQPAKS